MGTGWNYLKRLHKIASQKAINLVRNEVGFEGAYMEKENE